MTFDEIVAALKAKQVEIEEINKKVEAKRSECQEKLETFAKGLQLEVDELDKELQTKIAHYKAETKKHFGVCDGEKMNVVDTLVAFKKAMAL